MMPAVRILGRNLGWAILAMLYAAFFVLTMLAGTVARVFGDVFSIIAILIFFIPYGTIWLALSLILKKDWRQPLGLTILGVVAFYIFLSNAFGW